MATTMTPMAHPLPLPTPSICRPSINHFCPHLLIGAIGVLRSTGQYYFYCFDYTQKRFVPLPCLGCQPETTERDLFPLYAEYCKELDAHVCFTYNALSCKVEQYVFEQTTGGFEEVHRPEMVHDIRKPYAEVLCVVEETEEYGMVVIQRDIAQHFKKSRFYHGQYLNLPPVRVKTLMVQRLDDLPMTPVETEEFRVSFPSTQNYILLQSCPRYPGIYVVCVRQEDHSMLRLFFSEQTGEFHPVNCPECTGPVTENFLHPLYAVHSKALGEQVIFMENFQSIRLEQYVFCESRRGFKQVEDMNLVFDNSLINHEKVILKKKTGNGAIHLSRTYEGFMQKMMFVENKESQKIPPTEVRTFAIQKKEEEEQRRNRMQVLFPAGDPLASYKDYLIKTMQLAQSQAADVFVPPVVTLAALEQQQLLILANVPVPVTVTPESESDDSEVDDESDSEGSETGSESGSEEFNDFSEERDLTPEETAKSRIDAEMFELQKTLSELDVSKHQEQPPSEVFTHGYVAPARAISPEPESEDSEVDDESDSEESDSESGSEDSDSDSGLENESAYNDAEPDSASESKSEAEVKVALQKEAVAQKARALKISFQHRHAEVKRCLARIDQVLQSKAAKVPAPSTAVVAAVPPESDRNDSKVDDKADSGENESESGAESGPEDAGSSSDGSFEKVDSEAVEDSEDSDYSDIEDYDTCDDQ